MATPRRPVLIALTLACALPALAFACNGSSGALTGGNPGGDSGSSEDAGALEAASDAPVSFIVDGGAPDTFVPLNAVDAADIPDGGARVTPGVIGCELPTTCNQFAANQCCVGAEGGACLVGSVTCPSDTVSVTCNESADCVVGKVCCGSVVELDAGFTGVSAACAASCTVPPLVQLCRTNGECPDGGPCVIQTCSDGNTYELCGLYTAPVDASSAFTCTPK
jgi:hypothetical protein